MEEFFQNLKKELGKCTEWQQVSNVFESGISPENIPILIGILSDFSITDPEINCVIERNLDKFLEQMKIVCFHVISTFFNNIIRYTKKTEFFTIHVKWFYLIFIYFSLKRMVCQELIVWQNFRANQNIQKMFIDALMKYERELPMDFYDKGLRPNFRILLTYITSSPSSMLKGIGGVPDYMSDYPY